MQIHDLKSFIGAADNLRRPYHQNYYAMYSSVLGGIVTDPVLMMVPVDDHLVHRGDGVFETFKCVRGAIYNMAAHLDRLERSAAALSFKMPMTREEIVAGVVETVRAGKRRDCLIRVLVSRGPGGFGVNPYECPVSQIYVIVTKLDRPFMETHPNGAAVCTSSIPAKPPMFACVKNCNYLPNVLMKKEAVDKGADFAAAFDERGHLTEGAAENICIVTGGGELIFPRCDGVLSGTTMMRVMDLAGSLVTNGVLASCGFGDIPKADIEQAAEVLIVGTTPNVTWVREFDGRKVGAGKAGPVFEKLSALLLADIAGNSGILTPVPGL